MEELKYTVDDEVLIKGKVVNIYGPGDSSYPYRIKFDFDELAVTSTDIFTESCIVGTVDEFVKVGENQKTYEQGLNDAWEMAKKIAIGLELCKLQTIYDGFDTMSAIIQRYSAQEAIDLYNAWKERNEIKMGDIVEVVDCCNGMKELGIFYHENDGCLCVLLPGYAWPQNLTKTSYTLRKVGESGLDIAGALKKIREME